MTDKEFDKNIMRAGIACFAIVAAGQYSQNLTNASGDFVFPQYVRHHLSNVFDGAILVPLVASTLKEKLKMSWTKAAITAGVISLSVGVGWEVFSAQQPNRKFDWVHSALYVPSAVAMTGGIIIADRRRKQQVVIPAPKVHQSEPK